MANNLKVEVTKEQFENETDLNKKMNFMYSAIIVSNKHCEDVCVENEKKFGKLFRRRKIDTGIAAFSGGVGGFLAVVFKNIAGIFK